MTTLAPPQVKRIQTQRQAWCKNPAGYEKHQLLLIQLVNYFEAQGLTVEIPEDLGGWDLGRDLTVNGVVLDLKGIGLKPDGNNLVWDSFYYQRKAHPATYTGSLTEWFVHIKGDNVGDWLMGPAALTFGDDNDCNPYYKAVDTMTVAQFAKTHV